MAHKPLSAVQSEALHGIHYGQVHVTNKGQTDSVLKPQTVASLVSRGLVVPNGAVRRTVVGSNGRRYSGRKLVLTAAGRAAL